MNTILAFTMAFLGGDGESAGGLLLADPVRVLEAAESGARKAARRKPQSNPFGQEDPRPLHPETGRPVRPTPADTWLYFALSPLRGARSITWHGLFHTPSLEEALALPYNTYHVHLSVDLATADWSSEDEGGTSRWKAAYLTETFEYNYAPIAGLLLGIRMTAGELGSGSREPLRVFENGEQLIPDGDRGMALQSIVGRVKYVRAGGPVDIGGLVEIKIPTSTREDFLTAGTVDVAASAIVTKRWNRFAVHLNAGVTVPVGDADLLVSRDDAGPFPHAGIGGAWMPADPVAIVLQLEYSGAAFRDVSLWRRPSIVAMAGGRFRISNTVFLSLAIGSGLTEESGSMVCSGGIDVTF